MNTVAYIRRFMVCGSLKSRNCTVTIVIVSAYCLYEHKLYHLYLDPNQYNTGLHRRLLLLIYNLLVGALSISTRICISSNASSRR